MSRRVAVCRCFRELSVGARQYMQRVKNTYEFLKESSYASRLRRAGALILLSELIYSANLGGTTEAVFRPIWT